MTNAQMPVKTGHAIDPVAYMRHCM